MIHIEEDKNFFIVRTDSGFMTDSGKPLPYGTTLGLIGKGVPGSGKRKGSIRVWMPAASTPRGYKDAAKRELENVKRALQAEGRL